MGRVWENCGNYFGGIGVSKIRDRIRAFPIGGMEVMSLVLEYATWGYC